MVNVAKQTKPKGPSFFFLTPRPQHCDFSFLEHVFFFSLSKLK